MTSFPDKVKFLLDNKLIEHKYVKWGSSERLVYIINGKKFQYKGYGSPPNNSFYDKIIELYKIENKFSNNNIHINDIMGNGDDNNDKFGLKQPLGKKGRYIRRTQQTKTIQKWVREQKENFKQGEHNVQIFYKVKLKYKDGNTKTLQYQSDSFKVNGGKVKLRKAIERKYGNV